MPTAYTGPTGPTASYPGDSNDYSGGGSSWFDNNGAGLIDTLGNLAGDFLQFGSDIYAVQNGQPPSQQVPGYGYAPGYYPPQQPQQQPQNTVMYIVLAVIVLLLVLGGAYLITRK